MADITEYIKGGFAVPPAPTAAKEEEPKPTKLWEQPVYFGVPEGHEVNPARKFQHPMDLWRAACKYFRWCEENPIVEAKHFHHDGVSKLGKVPKMRTPTMTGLWVHIGISQGVTSKWTNPDSQYYLPEMVPVIEHIKAVIRDEKFTAAAAGVLNANLIARDLALMDRKSVTADLTHTGWVGGKTDDTPDEHKAVHIHPDDPDPLGENRPLFSRQQIDAGIPFFDPNDFGANHVET
jgi:hypothetical protein